MSTAAEADMESVDAATSFQNVTDTVCELAERRHTKMPRAWWYVFMMSWVLLGCLAYSLYNLFTQGIGVWGNNNAES